MELPKSFAELNRDRKASGLEEANEDQSPDVRTAGLTMQKASSQVRLIIPTTNIESDKQAEIQDLTRLDKNRRTVLHRAALDQNVALVTQLCERAERVRIKEQLGEYVDSVDKFGNTPLLTACVVNHNSKKNRRLKRECLQELIKRGAYPNTTNHTTLWTPLMWCSFYGDTEAIQLLLDYKAFAYLCDKDGLFPLDHCGLQDKDGNRKDAAEALIKNLMELIRKFDENENSLYPEYTGYERYIKSPLLRTSIAYWAIYFKLEDAYITELIGTEGVYPDLPLKTISGRNCYHACAYQGNGEVLKMLLERERYQRFYKKFLKKKRALGYGTSKAAIERDETERMFGFTVLELKNKTYSEDFIQYTKDSVKWVMKFEKVVAKIVNEDGVAPRHFEAQDSFGNTPLHVASFLGKTELVKMLLEQGANIQIENKDGWRCQELRQYPEIEDLYKQYVHQSQKKEIAGELVKNTVGVHLHIMPLAHAALVDKKSGKLFGFKNLFRKYKVADTVKAQSKKIQNELNEQSSLCNEQRLIPDVVLVFQADPLSDSKQSNAAINRINFNISLIKGKFTGSYLASNINNTLFYLMIKMDKNELEKECASNAIKIKLLNSYNHQVYDINRKVDFEPFRSRQRQEITLASLNKLIDIQQLKDMGVLKDVYTMHTVSGINRIREAWINTRWYWPEPLASMKDYFREGKHLNFTAITTLRMYFGEKVAFYFAWTCFYTNFLFLLAVPGLAVYIALEVDPSLVPLLLPIWVTYNSLCSTLVVERWKRKSSEIATRWGTIDMVNDTSRKRTVRTEFIGDETVHESTGILTKINVTSRTTFYFLVSLPILLVLLAAVVASFFGTQYIQINYDLNYLIRMLISAVNGFLLSIINIVYSRIARYFVDKENHKYSDTYENSLIFKVFIFQFLNSYLGLFYVIFYQGFSVYNVQFLMISLLVSKQVSSLASACIIPWLLYKFKKTNYFKSLKTKAKADDKERERRRQTSIDPKAETKKDLAVVRSVLNCHTGNPETDNWDLTRVELSSMRKRNDEFVDEYGQMFTQCGYVTMFAPAFPIGPAISLVANIIDIRAKLFALLHIHHRPPVEKAGDIGYWQTIWEVISIIGIFFNAVILFFNTDTTIGFIEDNIMDYVPSSSAVHDIRRLWAFLILVHLLLIIKLLVIALIKDKPAWVLKEEKKQIHEERQALQNQKALATASVILDAQKDGNSSRDNINQKGSGKSGSIKEVHATSKTGSLPLNSVALELNHGIKTILYNTYTHIEKDLVMKRLGHLANLVQEIVIKCDVCKKNKALLECLNCSERYCDKCLVDVHNKTAKSTHKIIYLDKSYTAAANQAIKGAALDVVPLIRDFPTRDEELSETLALKSELDWQKVEAFSFPTIGTGDPYHSVEKAYKLLHRIYIEENGISAENIITNIERALKVKKSLDAEGNSSATKTTEKGLSSEVKKKTHQPDQGGELSSGLEAKKDLGLGRQCDFGEVDYSWLDEVKRYFEMGKFNLEEKLWMNRIAFMVFKKRGGKTTYGDFYRQLKILENSQFEAKVILLFDLLDEDSDGIITLNDLLKVMSMSFLQNVKTRNCHEDLMKAAFSGTATIDKKGFLEKLLNNSQAKMVMKAYLQVRSLDGKA